MTERPVDVWIRHARVHTDRIPRPDLTGARAQFTPESRPSLGWRLAPVTLIALVLLVDAVMRLSPPFLVTGLLDEIAHLATTLVLLAGLSGSGIRISRWTALGAVLAGNLIDLDHLPQYAGLMWLTDSVSERPFTHSITTILLLLAVTAGAAHRGAVRATDIGIGAAIGLTGHFTRDIAGAATAVLWPFSTVPISIPTAVYVVMLALCAVAWFVAGTWPRTVPVSAEPGPSSGPAATPPAHVPLRRRDKKRPGLTPTASRVVVAASTLFYIWFITDGMIERFRSFRLAGFDTGIFAQGVWLLSQGQDPFVTVRGLHLFADHSSFVLLLIAPLFALLPHVELLLVLQTLGTALAAPVMNAFFLKTGHVWPATVFPLLYLLYPAQQWGVTFEFHPESLAPVFLVLGLHLAVHSSRRFVWALPLLVALSCKEDVSLVVAGLGLLLMTLGLRRRGLATLGLGLAWFLLMVGLVIPAFGDGQGTIYFDKNFGIEDTGGAFGWITFLPHIVELFFEHAAAESGLAYLGLVLIPVGLLALFDAKWMLPAAAPLFINLASQVEELSSIKFHYLLTSSPFIVIAAFFGFLWLGRRVTPSTRHGVLVGVTATALVASSLWGAVPKLVEEKEATPPATQASAERAVALIPDGAVVSASWNAVPHLALRQEIYDFPVPFDKGWWGRGEPGADRAGRVTHVVLLTEELRDMDKPAYSALVRSGKWTTLLQENGVHVLTRAQP